MNKCRKIIIGLKKLKIQVIKREKKKEEEERIKKKRKGKLHRTAKAHMEAEVHNNNKKCD